METKSRLNYDCDVGVRADIIEKRISHGRELVATAAATISQMKKRVANSDKALIEMEERWSYVAGADNAKPKNHVIFEDRVDDARALCTELKAECAIKSKRLVEYQEKILGQLSVMETDLAALKAEKRNVMIPLPGLGIRTDDDNFSPRLGMENDDYYYRTLRTAWEDAEKRARDAGLDCHTWPIHRTLSAVEYAKELMLHLSNVIHQSESSKKDLAREVDKRDARIREKDILLGEKDAQIRHEAERYRRDVRLSGRRGAGKQQYARGSDSEEEDFCM